MFQRNAQLLLIALIFMTATTYANIPNRRRTLSSSVGSSSSDDTDVGGGGGSNATALLGGARIPYGATARNGQFPWAARLFYNGKPFCGGALIYPRVILTASHCFFNNDGTAALDLKRYSVQVGIVDVTATRNKVYKVSRIILNSKYKHLGDNSFADIALLQLSTRATAPAKVIALPSTTTPIKAGSKLILMGWGESDDYDYESSLQYTTLTAGSKTACAQKHKELAEYIGGSFEADHFCTLPDPLGKIACYGDSGGPYVYKPTAASKPMVLGVVSYGPTNVNCGEVGGMDFPTSVPYWRRWISAMVVKYKLQN